MSILKRCIELASTIHIDADAETENLLNRAKSAAAVDLRRLRPELERSASDIEKRLEVFDYIRRCMDHGPVLDFFVLQGILAQRFAAKEGFVPSDIVQSVSRIVDSTKGQQKRTIDKESGAWSGPWTNEWTALAGYWCFSGFPRVTVGHKLAASLMCTTMPEEHRARSMYPWPAFVIDIPPGMIPAVNAEGFYEHALVFRTENGGCYVLVLKRDGFPDVEAQDLNGLLTIDAKSIGSLVSATEQAHSATHMIARLVVGVVAELESHRDKIQPTRSVSERAKEKNGFRVQTYSLTRDVVVDCRESVKRALRGGGGIPSVQVMVRGHWKNQVCGVGRADRKWIHVEPYWRGPEEMPTAIRSHKLG